MGAHVVRLQPDKYSLVILGRVYAIFPGFRDAPPIRQSPPRIVAFQSICLLQSGRLQTQRFQSIRSVEAVLLPAMSYHNES